jgi:uncharacterized protein (DUF39 family)
MGVLKPEFGNITYSTSGELSPLLNDPEMRTIGIGTRIFLAGAQGFVTWNGTQFRTDSEKNAHGIPLMHSATLTVTGNMKDMSTEFIRAAYYQKYGVSMFVGIGIPIPVLDVDIAKRVSIKNSQIETYIRDYGCIGNPILGKINYQELQSGKIQFENKIIPTQPMSSIKKARKIAEILKEQIQHKTFFLSEAVQAFPKINKLHNLKTDD